MTWSLLSPRKTTPVWVPGVGLPGPSDYPCLPSSLRHRPEEPPDFLTLFEGSPGGRKRPASLSKASSEKGATWNVLVRLQLS